MRVILFLTLLQLAALAAGLCAINGVVGGGEQCDDGNFANGDGCSNQCAFEQGGWACTNTTTLRSNCTQRADACAFIQGACPTNIATAVCSGANAQCTGLWPVAAGYGCYCPVGYRGSGLGPLNPCVDINECVENRHTCYNSTYCTNLPGSFACSPPPVTIPIPTVTIEVFVFTTETPVAVGTAVKAAGCVATVHFSCYVATYTCNSDGKFSIVDVPEFSNLRMNVTYAGRTHVYKVVAVAGAIGSTIVYQKSICFYMYSPAEVGDRSKGVAVMYWNPHPTPNTAAIDIDFYITYGSEVISYLNRASLDSSIALIDNFNNNNVNFEIATLTFPTVRMVQISAKIFPNGILWSDPLIDVSFDFFVGGVSIFTGPLDTTQPSLGNTYTWFSSDVTFGAASTPVSKIYNQFTTSTAPVTTQFCGNGVPEPVLNEQCDSVNPAVCVQCACSGTHTYDSVLGICVPVRTSCLPILDFCGNGRLDQTLGEMCDGVANCNSKCQCDAGYRSLSPAENRCAPINECALGWHNCDPSRGVCTDTSPAAGNFTCACASGYYGNGVYCSDALCGNGVVDVYEECDDGNYANGDGCSCSCRIEPLATGGLYVCTDNTFLPYSVLNPQSVCAPPRLGLCGDGMVDAGEACDDGNLFNDDGCSAGCRIEQGGWVCSSLLGPSVCSRSSSFCAKPLCNTTESLHVCGAAPSVCTNNFNTSAGAQALGFSCSCPRGYSGDGQNGTCVDQNECLLGTHNCASASKCVNLIGSWRCTTTAQGASLTLTSTALVSTGAAIVSCRLSISAIDNAQRISYPEIACANAGSLVTTYKIILAGIPYTLRINATNSAGRSLIIYNRVTPLPPNLGTTIAVTARSTRSYFVHTVGAVATYARTAIVDIVSFASASDSPRFIRPAAFATSGSVRYDVSADDTGRGFAAVAVSQTISATGFLVKTFRLVMNLAVDNVLRLDLIKSTGSAWLANDVAIYVDGVMVHSTPMRVDSAIAPNGATVYILAQLRILGGALSITPLLHEDGFVSSGYCGDGIKQTALQEECDSGTARVPSCVFCRCVGSYTASAGAACTDTMPVVPANVCGNGLVDLDNGETCERGTLCSNECTCPIGTTSDYLTGTCTTLNECASARLNNCSPDALCTNTAHTATRYTCACKPGYYGNGITCYREHCGDGIIGRGEVCDDGNYESGDGCSCVCSVEDGFACYSANTPVFAAVNPQSTCVNASSITGTSYRFYIRGF